MSECELRHSKEGMDNPLDIDSPVIMVYVTGGAASKLSKIRVVRKNIARSDRDQTDGQRAVLCVALSPSTRLPSRLTPSFQAKKCLPTDIRYKKTRAMRRALTKHEASIKSAKQLAITGAYKRETKLLPTLIFIKSVVWKNLFNKEADKLERSNDDNKTCEYELMIVNIIEDFIVIIVVDEGISLSFLLHFPLFA
ncbi:hypothetical protein PRIPAC_81686 [Pristionchus pacificus]|uniref:Large ribosomal subunit protein uL29 n=1 Tax=Pristionchus pacificus TaxID=54126 RepID=A0A2A6CBP5_PRIPA|nr:hypothetical protein PRIPAC_81686 [Pristionchus pacificus]|eukprot:PDM75498.1 hypothetical protein PRIPAC_42675 [Pristionchus pacificus]